MGRKNKPKAGSRAYYPRVRAKSIVPKFNSYGNISDLNISGCKPLCFYTFKVGMSYVIAKNAKQKASNYAQDMSVPVTVLETPDLKVVGARFYKDYISTIGKKAVFEISNQDKDFKKRIGGNKQKKSVSFDEIIKRKEEANSLNLICLVQASKTGVGQKKPVIVEIPLSGNYEEQINYFKEKFNKTISVDEVFTKDNYLDAKSISIGHGFTGPVKRFGIKVQRPKHQQIQRHVGSISPWHPATVMFTVPRAGQHGFHNRTSFNKKLLIINDDVTKINPKKGFTNYGVVKNKYIIVAGNVPGPSKRIVALRNAIRKQKRKLDISEISYISK
jgi:large subunit ribosomal protein L3